MSFCVFELDLAISVALEIATEKNFKYFLIKSNNNRSNTLLKKNNYFFLMIFLFATHSIPWLSLLFLFSSFSFSICFFNFLFHSFHSSLPPVLPTSPFCTFFSSFFFKLCIKNSQISHQNADNSRKLGSWFLNILFLFVPNFLRDTEQIQVNWEPPKDLKA